MLKGLLRQSQRRLGIHTDTNPIVRVSAEPSHSLWPRGAYLRRFSLPVVSGIFALYVAFHSPVRDIIAALFRKRPPSCYFLCGDTLMRISTIDSIAAIALIAGALLAAWIVADAFDGASYERPLIFGLSTFAFVVVPAATIGGIASFSGTHLLRPPTGPLLAMIPAVLVVLGSIWRGWRPHQLPPARAPLSDLVWFIGLIGVGLLVISTLLSLVRPPDGGDAISYHAPLAVFLWRDGNLTAFLDRAPMTWALAYPASAESWYGLLGIAGGEGLADLGQLPFALIGALAVGVFTRRLGFGRGAAYLAGAAFLLAPTVVMQSTTQANDIAGSGLLMATAALACAPSGSWCTNRFVWLGLGLGLVVTTKLALVPYASGLALFVIGAAWQSSHLSRYSKIRVVALRLLTAGFMFLLVAGPWWLRNIARYGNAIYPVAIPFLGRGVVYNDFGRIDGEFVPSPIAWPLYPFVEAHDDRSGFGMLFAVAAIPGLLIGARSRRGQPLLIYGLMAAFMLPAWWMFSLHEPRFLLPLSGLGGALIPGALLAVKRRQRPIAAILVAAAAVFSALVTFDQALLPLARQPVDRAEFYNRVWGVDPILASIPEREGLLHHTGFGPPRSDYAGYYPLLGAHRRRLVIPVDSELSTDSVIAHMRAAAIRYAYISVMPEARTTVEAIYDPSKFELVQVSEIERGESSGARRYLYQSVQDPSKGDGIRRYLYRLK